MKAALVLRAFFFAPAICLSSQKGSKIVGTVGQGAIHTRDARKNQEGWAENPGARREGPTGQFTREDPDMREGRRPPGAPSPAHEGPHPPQSPRDPALPRRRSTHGRSPGSRARSFRRAPPGETEARTRIGRSGIPDARTAPSVPG